MKQILNRDRCALMVGDCRDIAGRLPENSVDAIITDPPYELGFMAKKWDRSGVSFDPQTWMTFLRILKPGGYLLAFGGSRTSHRITCAIEDAGFQIRDVLMWLYGSGFPKSLDVAKEIDKRAGHWRGRAGSVTIKSQPSKGTEYERTPKGDPVTAAAAAWAGWGTALKPAYEPITMARKPLIGTVTENVLTYGTGAINVDACRVGQRWPANVMLDDDAADALGEQSRFFYTPKTSRFERNTGCDHLPSKSGGEATGRRDDSIGSKNPRAGAGGSGGVRNFHPTVKPIALMRWLVRMVTPPNGLAFDPFAGSGSTGVAALAEGFRFLGAELSEEYAEIATARLTHVLEGE